MNYRALEATGMQDLRVIGVENGALLVISDEGERFRIPIDEVLQSKLRQTSPEPGTGRKLSPREIQSHIRSGMSAQDVASITGVPVEYIQKFEGPVLAEREFVVETALAVRVHTALETDPMVQGATFGSAITGRLHGLGAINERWASWKEQGGGWVIKLSFTADQIDHDARWSFDPRKLALAPLNQEAITLSQQGESPSGLVPRLRAVTPTSREADSTRFDSGAFDVASELLDARGDSDSIREAATRFAPDADTPADHNQTADLLDALRRRRGEREAASFVDDSDASDAIAAHPSSQGAPPSTPGSGIRLVDVPLAGFLDEEPDDRRKTAPQPRVSGSVGGNSTGPQPGAAKARKGRATMPSWDDIVFGARSDDDPA
ncbi:MAG: septation protein SepH [Microbacteriaceae bacterium]